MAPLWCRDALGVMASGASLWLNSTFTAADVPGRLTPRNTGEFTN